MKIIAFHDERTNEDLELAFDEAVGTIRLNAAGLEKHGLVQATFYLKQSQIAKVALFLLSECVWSDNRILFQEAIDELESVIERREEQGL